MAFAEITNVDGLAFYTSQLCGILGLAYGTISINKLPTFVDSSDLSDKSFAFYMHLNPEKSFMTIPGYEESAMNGNFQFHNVVEERYWSLKLTGLAQGDKKIDAGNYLAVIDSGTSVMVGPTSLVDQLTEGIEVAEDCSNLSELPDITFQIDNIDYVLAPKDYVLEIDDSGDKACMLAFMGQEFPEGFHYFILGDSFMRRYYSFFDKNNNRVGFVEAA